MNVIRVSSWNELNDCLFDGTWDPTIRRFRSTFAYRGVADAKYPLTNGLTRLGRPYKHLERNLLKQFKKYARRDVVERDTDWHWLSVAQHHGLPTRLFDWTYSPYVALHFATVDLDDHPGKNAAVWKVNYSQVHELLQDSEKRSLTKWGARIFSVDVLSETIEDLDVLDSKHARGFDIAVFFEPSAIDDRIVNQFAYFCVLSDPFLPFDKWLRQRKAAKIDATKIIIPNRIKWEIRDKLDQCNINERVLMTGVDGLCAWLKRHYKPR